MKLVNFKISVFAIAIGFVITACGGEKSKQEGETSEIEKQAESVVEQKEVSIDWESNKYTKLLPKPEMSIKDAIEDAATHYSGEVISYYTVYFDNPTLEQVRAYVAKLKAAGFNVKVSDSDLLTQNMPPELVQEVLGDKYYFTAENASGWKVNISRSQNDGTLKIWREEE